MSWGIATLDPTQINERRSLIEPIAPPGPDIAPKRIGRRRTTDLECLLSCAKGLKWQDTAPDNPSPALRFASIALRVRDRGGAERFLRANPAQLAFERHRARSNIVLKARQMGITTWIAGRFFLKTIMARGVLTVQVAHTQDAAESIFQMVQRFWNCLDEEDRGGPLRRSIANVRAMRFPELDSEFRVLSASDETAGRGLTMQNLHCSEVGHWPGDAGATLAGLRAALSPGGELIIESTPNGAYGCFYEEWSNAVGADSPDRSKDALVRHFFPWWIEPAYTGDPVEDPSPEEQSLMLRHGLTPGQIGFRRTLESRYRSLRAQEYAEDPETCFRATGDCCFDTESIEARLAELTEPFEAGPGDALHTWLPPRPDRRYLVAVDTAGGGAEGDFAAIQVIDLDSGLQCAEHRERLRPMQLARAAAGLATKYGNAILAVERNNHGAGVLAYLQMLERYPRLYQSGSDARGAGERGKDFRNTGSRSLGELGWLTTAASKPLMVARMGELLLTAPRLFLSRRLLAECRTFVASPGGATGAASGAHDDCFMAMAVAHAVRAEFLAGRKVL